MAGIIRAAGGSVPVTLSPPPARLISPGQGEVVRGPILKFLWSVVDEARSYHLEVAADRDFLLIERNIFSEKNSYPFKDLTEGTYFWRVSSVNAEGLEGRHSQVNYFIYPEAE